MTLTKIIFLSIITASLVACKPKAAEEPVTDLPAVNTDSLDNQSYRIISDTTDASGNQVMDVELTKQEDSTGLRYLAVIINEQREDSLTAIRFFLPASSSDSPYATINFFPNTQLTIHR